MKRNAIGVPADKKIAQEKHMTAPPRMEGVVKNASDSRKKKKK